MEKEENQKNKKINNQESLTETDNIDSAKSDDKDKAKLISFL